MKKDTASLPKQNKNSSNSKAHKDANNSKIHSKDLNFNSYDPNTEVPLIGDDDKEITESVTMDKSEKSDGVITPKKPENEKRMKERDSVSKTEDSHS
jgi:hypothetical protein